MQVINLSRTSLTQATSSSVHLEAWKKGRCVTATTLQWARRGGMGELRSLVETGRVLSHATAPINVSRRAGRVRAAFTSRQEALVKDTWAILKKDAARHGLSLFLTVFEIAPAAKKLFPFLKDSTVPLEKNAKLKAHALQVFVIICEAASSLSKKGEVLTPGSTMKDMAHAHVISGVVDEHYNVVRYSLLKTVEAGLPAGSWNEEVKNAWGDAYDELVLAIKAQEEYVVPT